MSIAAVSETFQRVVSVVLIVFLLSGCASMSDSTRTKSEGTAIGTGVGAGVGAGIGYAAGGGKGALIGAILGALLGGAGGFWLGSTVAERKAKYVTEEDRLNGEIQFARAYNSKLKEYNSKREAQVKQMGQEVAELRSRYRAGKVRMITLQGKQNQIHKIYCEGDDCKKHMTKELVALREYQKSLNGTKDSQKVVQLNREIGTLKRNIDELDRNNRQLAKMQSSLAGVRK